ncbi:agglutinin-like protein 2 [Balamuthia mandrillaris]
MSNSLKLPPPLPPPRRSSSAFKEEQEQGQEENANDVDQKQQQQHGEESLNTAYTSLRKARSRKQLRRRLTALSMQLMDIHRELALSSQYEEEEEEESDSSSVENGEEDEDEEFPIKEEDDDDETEEEEEEVVLVDEKKNDKQEQKREKKGRRKKKGETQRTTILWDWGGEEQLSDEEYREEAGWVFPTTVIPISSSSSSKALKTTTTSRRREENEEETEERTEDTTEERTEETEYTEETEEEEEEEEDDSDVEVAKEQDKKVSTSSNSSSKENNNNDPKSTNVKEGSKRTKDKWKTLILGGTRKAIGSSSRSPSLAVLPKRKHKERGERSSSKSSKDSNSSRTEAERKKTSASPPRKRASSAATAFYGGAAGSSASSPSLSCALAEEENGATTTRVTNSLEEGEDRNQKTKKLLQAVSGESSQRNKVLLQQGRSTSGVIVPPSPSAPTSTSTGSPILHPPHKDLPPPVNDPLIMNVSMRKDSGGLKTQLQSPQQQQQQQPSQLRSALQSEATMIEYREKKIGHYDGHYHPVYKKHGIGRFEYEGGAVYEGQWRHNERHGYGSLQYETGEKYQGQWHDDLKHGNGICVWRNGDVYEGQWSNNMVVYLFLYLHFFLAYFLARLRPSYRLCSLFLFVLFRCSVFFPFSTYLLQRNGEGIYKKQGLYTFASQWKDDWPCGVGKIDSVAGHVYIGEVLPCPEGPKKAAKYRHRPFSFLQNGKGMMIYPNGDKYFGFWRKGKRESFGIFIKKNGEQYLGTWKNDRPHHLGFWKYEDGSEYYGEFEKGWAEGKGDMLFPNGATLLGNWQKDVASKALFETGTSKSSHGKTKASKEFLELRRRRSKWTILVDSMLFAENEGDVASLAASSTSILSSASNSNTNPSASPPGHNNSNNSMQDSSNNLLPLKSSSSTEENNTNNKDNDWKLDKDKGIIVSELFELPMERLQRHPVMRLVKFWLEFFHWAYGSDPIPPQPARLERRVKEAVEDCNSFVAFLTTTGNVPFYDESKGKMRAFRGFLAVHLMPTVRAVLWPMYLRLYAKKNAFYAAKFSTLADATMAELGVRKRFRLEKKQTAQRPTTLLPPPRSSSSDYSEANTTSTTVPPSSHSASDLRHSAEDSSLASSSALPPHLRPSSHNNTKARTHSAPPSSLPSPSAHKKKHRQPIKKSLTVEEEEEALNTEHNSSSPPHQEDNRPYGKAIDNLSSFSTIDPVLKLHCLLRTSQLIIDAIHDHNSSSDSFHYLALGAEDKFPIFQYLLIKAQLPNIYSELRFLQDFVSIQLFDDLFHHFPSFSFSSSSSPSNSSAEEAELESAAELMDESSAFVGGIGGAAELEGKYRLTELEAALEYLSSLDREVRAPPKRTLVPLTFFSDRVREIVEQHYQRKPFMNRAPLNIINVPDPIIPLSSSPQQKGGGGREKENEKEASKTKEKDVTQKNIRMVERLLALVMRLCRHRYNSNSNNNNCQHEDERPPTAKTKAFIPLNEEEKRFVRKHRAMMQGVMETLGIALETSNVIINNSNNNQTSSPSMAEKKESKEDEEEPEVIRLKFSGETVPVSVLQDVMEILQLCLHELRWT